jgi:hypothetical protein
MSINRYIQQGQIKAAERRRILAEFQQLGMSIARCEETISSVMAELKSANATYQGGRSTRQEVEYLTILLDCAKRKLAWEKQIASLKKRAPALLEKMSKIMNDKDHPPGEELKAEILRLLQIVQDALQRLQALELGE